MFSIPGSLLSLWMALCFGFADEILCFVIYFIASKRNKTKNVHCVLFTMWMAMVAMYGLLFNFCLCVALFLIPILNIVDEWIDDDVHCQHYFIYFSIRARCFCIILNYFRCCYFSFKIHWLNSNCFVLWFSRDREKKKNVHFHCCLWLY